MEHDRKLSTINTFQMRTERYPWEKKKRKKRKMFSRQRKSHVKKDPEGKSAWAMTCSLCYSHEALTSLAPHERLPELPVIPREKPNTGATDRENPRDAPIFAT